MPERAVIANTSPLYYLHQVDRLDLLQALYGRLLIPPAVRGELERGKQAKVAVPDLDRLAWIRVEAVRSHALVPAIVDLGPGEAEVIALGLEHPGSLVILDDQLARRVAALNSLTYTGTLGVLVKAKRAGHRKHIQSIVERLRECGLWMTDELFTEVLTQAGE